MTLPKRNFKPTKKNLKTHEIKTLESYALKRFSIWYRNTYHISYSWNHSTLWRNAPLHPYCNTVILWPDPPPSKNCIQLYYFVLIFESLLIWKKYIDFWLFNFYCFLCVQPICFVLHSIHYIKYIGLAQLVYYKLLDIQ